MELFVSGVQVPKLGSLMDKMSRSYLLRKTNKEISLNKLIAHIATAAGEGKEWSTAISKIWNGYLNISYGTENEEDQRETNMQQEYMYWKTIKPKLTKDSKGQLVVTDLGKRYN